MKGIHSEFFVPDLFLSLPLLGPADCTPKGRGVVQWSSAFRTTYTYMLGWPLMSLKLLLLVIMLMAIVVIVG
jgi:hypothetical protein